MEKRKGYKIYLSIIVVIAFAVLCGLYGLDKANEAKNKTVVGNENIITAGYSNPEQIYNVKNQKAIKQSIEKQKKEEKYNRHNMLLLYDPFGTNSQSLYAYFKTKNPVSVSYTIHVDDSKINDFTRTLYNGQKDNLATEHEYQLIGLIPNQVNTITFTFTDAKGNKSKNKVTYAMGNIRGNEELILESEAGKSSEQTKDGLYVILGNDSTKDDFMYYYDNDGVLRGEVPIIDYRSHRIITREDKMYISIEEKKMAEIDRLGQVTNVFDLGNYELHHDYVFDDDGNILILATDTTKNTVQDMIIKLDIKSGEVTQTIDLGDLFGSYKAICKSNKKETMDWMHINTIQWMGKDEILLSSRETSSIIKVSNIYDKPTVEYMLGEKTFWESTDYSKYLFEKDGDFISQTGQHSITYVQDPSLEEGQYYLYMFNNNVGISTSRPDYDWKQVPGVGTVKEGENSKFYRYLVDEKKKTYKLEESFDVIYSPYISSAQRIDGNTVIDSGGAATFCEYDSNNQLIRKFKMEAEMFIYRVYKYTFGNFYFK